jgi:hypothetical protein
MSLQIGIRKKDCAQAIIQEIEFRNCGVKRRHGTIKARIVPIKRSRLAAKLRPQAF